MSARRWVVVGTAAVVAVLAMVFAVVRWEDANKIASAVSALAGLASVGVGVWAGLPVVSSGGRVRVSRTGRATARGGGRANTGVAGRAGALPEDVRVEQTGDADASGGGDANTGIQLN